LTPDLTSGKLKIIIKKSLSINYCHRFLLSRRPPSRLHSARVPRPALLRPHLWCGGWQALLWSLVDEWVSGGPGVRNGSSVYSLLVAVKIYNTRDVWLRAAGGSQPCGFV